MAYKVVGTLKHDGETFNHGDSITANQVGGDENFKNLQAANTVVTEDRFNELFPEQDGEVIQAPGTPSNLGEVEGTDLEAKAPEDQASKNSDESDNPTSPKQHAPAADRSSDAAKAPAAKKAAPEQNK